jgi:hypothetical protein
MTDAAAADVSFFKGIDGFVLDWIIFKFPKIFL